MRVGCLLLWLSLLYGCAGSLPPRPTTVARCDQSAADCMQQGRAAFAAYRQEKVQAIKAAGSYRLPSAPTAFLHPRRTHYAVLLVHGLNDSAYYMEDLGKLLYSRGFNVITILLPGHGTNTHDMADATAEQWRAEVQRGLKIASQVGDKVILGGFSLGAALALDAALSNTDVQGLLLFSPAIRLRSFADTSALACLPGLRGYLLETDLPSNPVKYKFRMGNSVCQLTRLMHRNLMLDDGTAQHPVTVSEKLAALANHIHVPLFMAVSFADQRIDPEAALQFAADVHGPVSVVTFGPGGSELPLTNGGSVRHIADTPLPHSYLVLRSNPYNGQENPYFDQQAKVLENFLARQFSAAAQDR